MNQKNLSRILVATVIALFLVSCFAQPEATLVKADSQWAAQPMHIVQSVDPLNSPAGYSPSQIKTAYGLPTSGGAGATIAIIDAYNTTTIWNDLTVFSSTFNLPPPTSSNFEIYNMSTSLRQNSGWAEETCLDVEWAHAIAPYAMILLVQATDNSESSLLAAVDYARNCPGVVAISMSWGGPEDSSVTSDDSYFTSINGAVFFASSGDQGSNSGAVDWPASSPNVVAVGGTTLNLNSDGTVISETAWSGSGGGVSAYEPAPQYQTSYGLNYPMRAVPDVSYDANPQTGVAVRYNSGWIVIGGTSVGAPQWAAIQADGLSATNANLYGQAKSAYSSYFRDVTSGSNGLYNAGQGYDLVTGLGSPLTCDFGSLTVSPTSGPAGGSVTLTGSGFTANSSVNISYLDDSTWVPIASDVPTDSSQNFVYNFTAPDLLQNNLVGDNQPASGTIFFQAQDNSNGNSYNTTIPYTEWRRGLTQVANDSAVGLFGNNTDLSTTAFVQNNESIPVAGEWFSPGNVTLLWDDTTSLGTFATDENGFFNATVQVSTTTAGPHILAVIDADSSFCVNVTRLPTVTNDYDGLWHTSNVTINLTPDYNVTETYYKINNGPIENVSANGQPVITTEGSNNTLEYWCTWNIYGTGTMELPPVILTGIQLETTPPSGSMQIDGGATSTYSSTVTLTVNTTDSISGISQIRFSNDGTWDESSWETFTSTSSWQLTGGDGAKTVYCQIQDNAGLIATLSASILLSSLQPMLTPSALATSSPSPSPDPTSSPSPTPTPSATPTPAIDVVTSPSTSSSPTQEPSVAPEAPELSIVLVIVLLVLSTTLTLAFKHKVDSKKQ